MTAATSPACWKLQLGLLEMLPLGVIAARTPAPAARPYVAAPALAPPCFAPSLVGGRLPLLLAARTPTASRCLSLCPETPLLLLVPRCAKTLSLDSLVLGVPELSSWRSDYGNET